MNFQSKENEGILLLATKKSHVHRDVDYFLKQLKDQI